MEIDYRFGSFTCEKPSNAQWHTNRNGTQQRKNGRPFAQENEIRQKTQNQCV